MNKITKRVVVAGVCAALCVGGVAGHAYANNNVNAEDAVNVRLLADNTVESDVNTLLSTVVAKDSVKSAVTKDETVYVMSKADGSVSKIIVSDWIKNGEYADSLNDLSTLTNIENVKGDETYTDGGNGAKVWASGGNDIYYTGNSDSQVPVSMKVTYILDGKEMTPSEIAGKSGKVTIKFEYTNNKKVTVTVDGKEETVAVPFVTLTGMLLDTDVFRNVEVSNGKLINDGERMAVVGYAVPGLGDIIGNDYVELPNGFEITADVTNFKLGMTVTVATNEVFNKLSTDGLDIEGGFSGLTGQLSDAMSQLIDGSGQLYDGLSQLDEKSGELAAGVNKLASGSEALKDGAEQLDAGLVQLKTGAEQLDAGIGQLKSGAGELGTGIGQLDAGAGQVSSGAGELSQGMNELKNGLDTLTSNNAALEAGAKQVFETLLATAESQLKAAGVEVPTLTIDNYGQVLDGVVANLDSEAIYNKALATVTAAVEANRDLIETKVTAAVREQVEAQVKAGVAAQMGEAALASPEVQAVITAKTDEQMKTKDVKALIKSNVETQIQAAIDENMNSTEVQTKLAAAKAGAQTISSLKASLDSYNTFYTGLVTYTNGVATAATGADALATGASSLKAGADQLAAGTSQLATGASQLTSGIDQLVGGSSALVSGADQLSTGASALATGAGQLDDGIDTLAENVPALVDGVGQLKDGAEQLKDGITRFNEEGIQKIIDLINDNLGNIVDKLQVIADASKQYNNYSGIADGMDGSVKFIYRTEEIK